MQKLGKLGGCFFVPSPMNTATADLGIAEVRLRAATNHFKRLLIGDLHIPGKPQTTDIFEALAEKSAKLPFTERTWQSWFSTKSTAARIEKIRGLDTFATQSVWHIKKISGPDGTLPKNTFSSMTHGGLVQKLIAPSKSKQLLHTLINRANDYHPLSPLHLHLDAIEVSALADGVGNVPWTVVKGIGAQRILELLDSRWSPRHGSVYSELSSDLRLTWESASLEEQLEIRKGYSRFTPNLFQKHFDAGAKPDWQRTGINDDISPLHIYKLLFALAADSAFLVADRLTIWSIDLATAALAMHAYAWADRYTTFGLHVTDEMLFWGALDEVFFKSEPLDADHWELMGAMRRCDADWDASAFAAFQQARELYKAELKEIGLTTADIHNVAMRATRVHSLSYKA